ncbi:MAG: hypothetical protein IKV57_11685 [Clostridia bacterium]|nr:hypothetical protein [Clostridia bacterium]
MKTFLRIQLTAIVLLCVLVTVSGCSGSYIPDTDWGTDLYENNIYDDYYGDDTYYDAGSAGISEQQIVDNIFYEIYEYHWERGKLYIRGTISNYNQYHDLLGMEEGKLIVTDSTGLPLYEAKINASFQENLCFLRPMAKVPYNFTSMELLYDESEYSSLTSGLQVFLEGILTYSECDGTECERCGYYGYALDSDPFAAQTGGQNAFGSSSSGSGEKNCFFCDFSGRCSNCGGDGKMESLDGSIFGTQCRTCDGTGVCSGCNGDGIMGR